MLPRIAAAAFIVAMALHSAAQPDPSARALEPRVDATTHESFEASFDRVEASVPSELREKFKQASTILMSGTVDALGEASEERALEAMRHAFHGKSANEIISAAEAIVRRMLESEQQRQQKATAVDMPRPLDLSKSASFACNALLSTFVKRAEPSVAGAFAITSSSLLKPPPSSSPERLEATSATGTDLVEFEIVANTLRMITRAAVEQGQASPAEFKIIVSSPSMLIAIGVQDGLVGGNANLVVLNKASGLAIWTKSRPASLLADSPDSQTHYLRCK